MVCTDNAAEPQRPIGDRGVWAFLRRESSIRTLVFASLFACFLTANVTNDVMAKALQVLGQILREAVAHRQVGSDSLLSRPPNPAGVAQLREAIFTICLVPSVLVLWPPLRRILPDIMQARRWLVLVSGLAVASVLIFHITPTGYGEMYKAVSDHPFTQPQSLIYRRILLPYLASTIHFEGAFYFVAFWLCVLATLALTLVYLESHRVTLSVIEVASMATVGMFAAALGEPGTPEILVLGLTMLAMLSVERQPEAKLVPLCCFGLALMAHETAAALAFGVLAVWRFGLRFTIDAAIMIALYVATATLEFGASVSGVIAAQMPWSTPLRAVARASPVFAAFSLVAAFKLMLLVAIVAIVRCVRAKRVADAGLMASALIGVLALTRLGADYTRIVSFASFAVIFAMTKALPNLSTRRRQLLAGANLLVPSIYVGIHFAAKFNGLYGLILGHMLDFAHRPHPSPWR